MFLLLLSIEFGYDRREYYKLDNILEMMKEDSTKQKIPIDISPNQYSQKHSKQLGNHFIYSKLTQTQKWNDPRLKILRPNYFIGKTILDIGCNEGVLSIPIAIKYQPKLVKAIDIDCQMTKKLRNNVEIFLKKNQMYSCQKEIVEEIQALPKYFKQKLFKQFNQTIISLPQTVQLQPKQPPNCASFPHNITTSNENILVYNDNNHDGDKFNCILCMNVTRWVHLAFGDEGIKQLFAQLDVIASDGCILILEAQPWTSYRKKRNLYPIYDDNYRMILLKPDRFKDYLMKLGFQLLQTIKPTDENMLKHEILIMQKKYSKTKQYY